MAFCSMDGKFFRRRTSVRHGMALLAAVVASPWAFALPDELQVHMDEINKPGQVGVDLLSSYTVSGPRRPSDEGLRPTFHLLQLSPDFSYGLTKNTQINLQLFSSMGLDGQARVDGGRVGVTSIPVRPEDEDDDGLFLGGIFEIGRLPRQLSTNRADAEIKLIAGYRLGHWTLATNPEIGFKVSGTGPSRPDLSVKVKVAYKVANAYSVGIEHFGELGSLHRIGPLDRQSQQTFAVIDFKAKGMDFNVGVGRGWNQFSERWVLKTILSFPIGE